MERNEDRCFPSESPRLVKAGGEGFLFCHFGAGAQKSALPGRGGAESRASREAAIGPRDLLESSKRRSLREGRNQGGTAIYICVYMSSPET